MRFPWARAPKVETEDRSQEALQLISKRLKECEDTLRANPNDADALFTKAVFLAHIGEYWKSLNCLHLVTKLDSAYPGVWHLKSTLYQRVGDHSAAQKCRERAHAMALVPA